MCVCVCMSTWRCVHVTASVWGGTRRTINPELRLQVLINCLIRVLGPELGSFARAVPTLNCWAHYLSSVREMKVRTNDFPGIQPTAENEALVWTARVSGAAVVPTALSNYQSPILPWRLPTSPHHSPKCGLGLWAAACVHGAGEGAVMLEAAMAAAEEAETTLRKHSPGSPLPSTVPGCST